MKQQELKQPFFAKLLESQKTNSQGNQPFYPITLKIFDDLEQTQKYPSDNDEYYADQA